MKWKKKSPEKHKLANITQEKNELNYFISRKEMEYEVKHLS